MKRVFSILVFVILTIMVGTGCAEHRYYVKHRDHSPGYYSHHPHRHHPDVDVRIRN